MSEPTKTIRIFSPSKGRFVRRKVPVRQLARPEMSVDPWRHHISQSVSVHPRQAERYRQFIKDMAVPGVTVDHNGQVGIASQYSQDCYLKALSRDKPPGEQFVNVDR